MYCDYYNYILVAIMFGQDVVNYEEFMRNLTNEEQQQLLKYLPVVDTAKFPDRLESVTLV